MDQRTCKLDGCDKHVKPNDCYCSMHRARVTRYGSPEGKPPPRPSISDRAYARAAVVEGDGCWLWTGYVDPYGYGVLRTKQGNLRGHRIMFERAYGPIPEGLVIDHICHNRQCVRPDHLRAVTQKQNVENFTQPVRAHNTSGFRGVSFHRPSGLWHVRVKHGSRTHSGGYYKTAADAGEAAKALRLALHTHNDMDAV